MKFETTNENKRRLDLQAVDLQRPADLVEMEQDVLNLWKELDLVEKVKLKNKGNPKFSFFDGPVTANNPLGVHHAWGRTLKDVVQRFKALQGYDQRFEYGFDTQGLWVEVEVEKALGFNSKKELEAYGIDQFVNDCKARVDYFSAVQDEQSLRLGMLKANESYYTHTDENVSAIWQFLKKCHENGWLYQGVRPMPWCSRCGTSLSSHEQADAYKEVEHTSVYVKFPLNERENTYLVVWTTTPWTLPANLAVAVHPEKEYGWYCNGNETLVAGLWLKDTLFADYNLETTSLGKELVNMTYTTAFSNLPVQYPESYQVVAWDEVTEVEGTGVVHLAPGCGQEDYNLLKDNLKPLSPLQEDGYYKQGYDKFSGLHYREVNHQVVEKLAELKLLVTSTPYTHRYPHCWRCKTELVYRLVDEWFVSMDELRPQLVKAADKVEWDPSYSKNLFLDWVNNMEDWCVSRKRYWGLPLPFYKCDCGYLTVVSSKEKFLKNAVGPVDDVMELHLPWVDLVQYPCENCAKPVDRVKEVGDCWLDAGVMPFSTLDYFSKDTTKWQEWFPADFVCEMREQVRLWFYSLMVLSVTFTGEPPFRTVLSYEMVRDKNNEEMHKSGKNNVVLDDALEELGADTLRLYYLSQSRSSNMRFDFDVGNQLFKLLRKLTHSFKFFQTYADLENFQFDPSYEVTNVYDRWMQSKLSYYQNLYAEAMNNFDLQLVVQILENSVDDLSSWYLRRVRERVWHKEDSSEGSVYNILFRVFRQLTVLFAPLTPFLAEVIYQNLRNYYTELQKSVHLEHFTTNEFRDEGLEKAMAKVQLFDHLNRQLRAEAQVKLRQPLQSAYLWDKDFDELPEELMHSLQKLLNVKKVKLVSDPTEFVNFKLLPDYSRLGPKLGKRVQDVATALQNTPQNHVASFYLGSVDSLDMEGFKLERDDVEVRLEGKNQLELRAEGDTLLLLELNLSDDLKLQGWLNDFSRHVQMERKNRDYHVEQRVELVLSGNTNLVDKVLEDFEELKNQLFLEEVTKGSSALPCQFDHPYGKVSYDLKMSN